MTRLQGVDASFLYFETPETPMHVAGFTLYEMPQKLNGDNFYQHFRSFIESRLHLIPIFGKKLAPSPFDLDHPNWVDDDDMDLDYHLRHTTLPKPGSFEQLQEVIGRLHSSHLDRSRPLWQFYVIDGLQNGQVAVYSKVHHAAVDGGAGMVITNALYDLTPEPRAVAPPTSKAVKPSREPGVTDIVTNFVRLQVEAWRSLPDYWKAASNMFLPRIDKDGSLSSFLPQSSIPQLSSILAPKTPLNVTITKERSYAARSLPLDDAKRIGKATGAKLNDVVMAICGGALRRYLQDKDALPKEPLVVFVPISLRELGNTDINNQVFGMLCQITTQIADPVERLKAIQKSSSEAKQLVGNIKNAVPQDYSILGAPIVLKGLMSLYGRTGLADVLPPPINTVISNTAGPQVPLYCAGAKVVALYPVSIPTHGVALNMTVQSYCGKLDFGLTACRRAVPDIAVLADYLTEAFDELKSAVLPAEPAPAMAAAPAKAAKTATPAKPIRAARVAKPAKTDKAAKTGKTAKRRSGRASSRPSA